MYQSLAVIVVNGLRSQRVNVHGAAADEVLYAPLYLRRAASVVRTVVDRLALDAHQRRAALRTARYELHRLSHDGALLNIHSHDFRYYLAAFLHIDVVAQMQVETLYEVLVVECGALDGCSCQLHGLHVGHRRYGTCAPHLIGNVNQSGACAFSLELICYCPSRTLGCEAQGTLLALGVHFQHYAVGGYGQVFAFLVPIVYEVENLLYGLHLADAVVCLWNNLEAP